MVFGLPGYPFRIAIWPIPKMSFWLPWKVILGGKSGKSPGSSLFKKAPLKSVEWCPQQNGPGWLIPLVMINFDSPLRMEGWMNLYDAAGCFGPQNSHFWGSNDPWVSVFFLGVCFLCFHPKRGARIEFVSFFMKTFGVFASNRFHRGKIWNCRVLGDEQSWAVMSNGSFFLYEIEEKMSWLLGGWEHQSGNHHLPVSLCIWKQESSLATWYIMQLGSLVPNIRNWKIPGEVCRSFWYSSFGQGVKANPGGRP